jgi:hypothetical protein
MRIGTLAIRLMIPEAHSLKQKRSVLKSIKDRLRNNFNISVSEVAAEDVWQSATIGVAIVGSDRRYMNAVLSKVVDYLRNFRQIQLIDYEMEFY